MRSTNQSTGRIGEIAYAALMLAALSAVLPAAAFGQEDEDESGWHFTAEFSSVSAGGNQETFTFGLNSTLGYRWLRSRITLEGGAVFSESSLKSRTAFGTSQSDFVLEEEKTTETTAEAYYARGRYDYDVSERFFLLTSVDWLRNTFAGIDSRFLVGAGAGNVWRDEERVRFKTDYSVTYTFQEDVVENPLVSQTFPGVRLAYEFSWQLTGSTEFESKLISDFNLDNTDDIRLDFKNALPISISSKLALKPALQLLWRNDPALTEVDLFTPDGEPTGDTVLVPLEKLDSFLTVALVLTL